MIAYFLGGCAIYGIVLFVLVMLRPKSALHTKKLTDCGRREKITIGVVLVILILLCTLPMGLAPGWNGEDPGATNQYELLAEAILNGHINIDNGDVDPLLLQMDNPYDPQARCGSRRGLPLGYGVLSRTLLYVFWRCAGISAVLGRSV